MIDEEIDSDNPFKEGIDGSNINNFNALLFLANETLADRKIENMN